MSVTGMIALVIFGVGVIAFLFGYQVGRDIALERITAASKEKEKR